MFELVIYAPAQAFFEALEDEAEKIEVRRLLRIISLNPSIDNRNKFQIPVYKDGVLLGMRSLYESGRFTIGFRVYANDMIHITAIAHSEYKEEPS